MSRPLFVFGLGYTGLALARFWRDQGQPVAGTVRTPEQAALLQAEGLAAFVFTGARPLSEPARQALEQATAILSTVPPDATGDPVLRSGLAPGFLLPAASWVGYLSTTGVYGDTGGAWVDEDSPLRPSGLRQQRRVAAEAAWLARQRETGLPVHLFRLAGIYGPGRNVLDSVRAGTARRIHKPGQVFSRIHRDDIVTVLVASMANPQPGSLYNLCDDAPGSPCEAVEEACRLLEIPPPPWENFADATLSPLAASFYQDNKRVRNDRLQSRLGVLLRYPDLRAGLAGLWAAEQPARPYGVWESTLSAADVAAGSRRFGRLLAEERALWWSESRPEDAGRSVVVRRETGASLDAADGRLQTAAGALQDWLAAPFAARSKVHEYGGGEFWAEGTALWFVNAADQGIWEQRGLTPPRRLTPARPTDAGADRYGDLRLDKRRNRLLAVRETRMPGTQEPVNALVAVALDGSDGAGRMLAQGASFYAAPAPSPDGQLLAWLEWDHPAMPWQETRLMLASLTPEGLPQPGTVRMVAGGNGVSVVQPSWSPEGALWFVDDRSGWWNLYRISEGWDCARPVAAQEAEFAKPLWQLGQATYAFMTDGTVVAAAWQNGRARLLHILPAAAPPARRHGAGGADSADSAGAMHDQVILLEKSFTDIDSVQRHGAGVAVVAGRADHLPAVWWLPVPPKAADAARKTGIATEGSATEEGADPGSRPCATPLRCAGAVALRPADCAWPLSLAIPNRHGETIHAFFYPPTHRDCGGPVGERPPMLVRMHGGPTGAATATLDLKIQFWTQRGFAVLDVNYTGSSGFGSAYRQRLAGLWGIRDVEDCLDATRRVIDAGWADGERLAISGSSAGGYSVLCALTFHNLFRAGASYYGIGDLGALMRDSHKFEAHYTTWLVGRPWPEDEAAYRARSPLFHSQRLSCPLIVFQGLADPVVPPSQAEAMVNALRDRNIPVSYLTFPDEGHGFRAAATVIQALEAEVAFYRQVFGLKVIPSLRDQSLREQP